MDPAVNYTANYAPFNILHELCIRDSPWIFKEVKHYLETGEELPPLSFDWCMEVLRQEVVDSVNLLDERRGILHVRRHLAASPLFKGIPNFRNTRIAMLRAETKEELFRIFEEITSQRKENPEI